MVQCPSTNRSDNADPPRRLLVCALLLAATAVAGCDYDPPPESALPFGDSGPETTGVPTGDTGDVRDDEHPGGEEGDNSHADRDGDGVPDRDDNCPTEANADQTDIDDDGEGDVCDDDTDGDGTPDSEDCAPRNPDRHPDATETCGPVDQNCNGDPLDVGTQNAASTFRPTAFWPFEQYESGALESRLPVDDGPRARPADSTDRPVLTQGVVGRAVDFDGTQYLAIPHGEALELADGTVMMWFRPDRSDPFGLWSKDAKQRLGGGHLSIRLEDDGGDHVKVRARLESTSEAVKLEAGSLRIGTWHHVAVTFGEEGFHLYVDGDQRAAEPSWTVGLWSGDGSIRNEQPVGLGVNRSESTDGTFDVLDRFLDGQIDELVVFDDQLDPSAYYEFCGPG